MDGPGSGNQTFIYTPDALMNGENKQSNESQVQTPVNVEMKQAKISMYSGDTLGVKNPEPLGRKIQINNDYDSLNSGSIFTNKSIQRAGENLTEEEKANFKKLGEQIHSYDYTEDPTESKYGKQYDEALAHLVYSLKSGIHPTSLNEDARNVLKVKFGDAWYQEFGFTEADLFARPIMKRSPLRDEAEKIISSRAKRTRNL